MPRFTRILSVLLVFALLGGCMPGSSPSVSKKMFQSEKPREASPQVAPADQAALAAGNAAFALDLYRALGQAGGQQNFFYSPYSISLALAMTDAGARGATATQMAHTLRFSLPQDRLHPAFNALDQELTTRKDLPGKGADGKGFRLNVVNDLWGEQEYTFLPAYLDLLAKQYGAGLRGMDFKNDPEGARQAINDYIAQKTEQRIKDLIPAGAIDPLTRLVLTNAIYFNAAWLNPFVDSLTQDAPFTRLDGSPVTVKMMNLPATGLRYGQGQGYQALALPYEGGKISMLVLVPDAGAFAEFEQGLDAGRLEAILQAMRPAPVTLGLPRFHLESRFDLAQTLAGLGMQDAFLPDVADFSGMDGTRTLYISDVVHKSFVKVDEAGTEAAAATAVMMRATGALADEPVRLTVDRPFIFLIRDEPTGALLFAGRVLDPSQ